MVRTVAPGTPESIDVKLQKIPRLDFSAFEKMGDAQIKAGLTNAKLYAQNLLSTEQQKLFEQYSADPIMLSNALGKLPDMISDVPQEVQDEMNAKLYTSNIGLVQKAQNNQLVLQDQQNKAYADQNINDIRATILENYTNVMKNAMSPADMKNNVANDIFLSQVDDLQTMSAIKDHNGKDIYSDVQKKAILNLSDTQLEAGKQFVDQMILNDDDELSQTKDYYQKFVLAPERFMAENYMNRNTYDKFRGYVEKQLKQADVDIKKMRFSQSVAEATALQVQDLPGTLKNLQTQGVLDKGLIKQIENTNVKFNNVDPSKTESPVSMINALQIIADQKYESAPSTEAEQQKILEQGVVALDSVADYAQEYGMSPKTMQTVRETVATIETNAAFKPILDNFRDIIDNFDWKMGNVRERTKSEGFKTVMKNITNLDGVSDDETLKLIRLNNLLASATDNINQLIRNGDWDGVHQEQKRVQQQAAQIKYDWIDWEKYQGNADTEFRTPNGRVVKIKNFTLDGDILFETLN